MQLAADGVGLGSLRRGGAGAAGTHGVGVVVGATALTQPEEYSASRTGVALGVGVAGIVTVGVGEGAAGGGASSLRVSSRTATSPMIARIPPTTRQPERFASGRRPLDTENRMTGLPTVVL